MACTNLTLTKGDVLYLPRGTIHVATTRKSTSIHMTYQLQTKGQTWADINGQNVDKHNYWLLNLGQSSQITASAPLPYKQRQVSPINTQVNMQDRSLMLLLQRRVGEWTYRGTYGGYEVTSTKCLVQGTDPIP